MDLRLDLGLNLRPECPLRIVPPHSVETLLLLSFRSGLHLDRGLHLDGGLRLLSLLSLLSLRSDLRLNRRLHLNGGLRLLSLLSLLSLWPGLRLNRRLYLDGGLRLFPLLPLLSLRSDFRLSLSLSGRSRLNLFPAPASAFALSPVCLSRPGLLLLRIGRPVLMLAAAAIVRLRPCCGSTRNQKGNGG